MSGPSSRLGPRRQREVGEIVYEALTVSKPRDGHAAMTQPEVDAPSTVSLFLQVLADTEDELIAAATAASNAFRNFEVEIVGDPELRASRDFVPPTVRTAGLTYDPDTEHLTIEAWAPQWHDVELTIIPGPMKRWL